MTRIAIATILVALGTPAFAQPAFDCEKTETQAECHARLKCKADEELEACQKRLRAAGTGNQTGNDGRDSGNNGDNGNRDNGKDRGRGRGNDRYNNDDGGGRRQRGRSGGRRRRGGGGGGGGGGFQANKTFGLGLELGEPTGLNGKYFLSDTRALDFGLGYIYEHYYYGDGIHLYVDHLWHPTSLVSSSSLEMPFYIGVGARYWSFEFCERVGGQVVCFDGSAVGLRIPIGISLDFNNAPIDIYFQLVPVIDILAGDFYNRFDDRSHFGIDGNVGFRFWFK